MQNLSEVLGYYHAGVISKFREDYYFDEDEASAIFKDLLRWLWMAAKQGKNGGIAMYHSMLVMDKMWHTFLSFTKDYNAFCDHALGRFVHHEPHTRGEAISQLGDNPQESFDKLLKEIESFQGQVYEEFGAETLVRWFATYPHVYSAEEMHRRTRPQFSQHGFIQIGKMQKMQKAPLLKELAATRHLAAWCGGPGCGPQCMEA